MMSQWQCIQQNIGTWQGSFTQFSPTGELVKDTPSVLTLQETDPGKVMQLMLERTPPGGITEVTRRSFNHPGPAPYVLFFENGAFSQGSPQWSAFGQFGAEMSLKVGDRRVRFVIMYDAASNYTSQLKYVTLIRESQPGGTPFSEPALTAKQLLGDWRGTVDMLSAPMAPMTKGTSKWQLGNAFVLTCEEQLGENHKNLSLASDTQATLASEKLLLLKGHKKEELNYQLMFLPNGVYCLIPQEIRKEKAFRIEVGWLHAEGQRMRLVRYYDDRGVWMRSALVEDSHTSTINESLLTIVRTEKGEKY